MRLSKVIIVAVIFITLANSKNLTAQTSGINRSLPYTPLQEDLYIEYLKYFGNDQYLVSILKNKQIQIWRTDTNIPIRYSQTGLSITDPRILYYVTGPQWVSEGQYDYMLYKRIGKDLTENELINTIHTKNAFTSVFFYSEENTFSIKMNGEATSSIQTYNLLTGELLKEVNLPEKTKSLELIHLEGLSTAFFYSEDTEKKTMYISAVDLLSSKVLYTFKASGQTLVGCNSISPNEILIITDRTIFKLNSKKGNLLKKVIYEKLEKRSPIAISKDQKHFAINTPNYGNENYEILRVYNTNDLTQKANTEHEHYKSNGFISFLDQSDYVITDNSYELRKIDINDGNILAKFSMLQKSTLPSLTFQTEVYGHTDEITDISANSYNIVSVSKDKSIRVWDVESGQNLRTFRGKFSADNDGELYKVAVSPDEKHILAGGYYETTGNTGQIKAFDFWRGEQIGNLERSSGTTTAMAFSADGKFFAAGHSDKRFYIWSREKLVYELENPSSEALIGIGQVAYEGFVTGLSFSKDNKRIVVSEEKSATFEIYELNNGNIFNNFGTERKHNKGIKAVAYSPDGSYIMSSDETEAHLWTAEGKHVKQFISASMPVEQKISFSPNGKMVLLGGIVYSFPEGIKLPKQVPTVGKVAAFISNETVAGVRGNKIIIWGLADGKIIKTLEPELFPVKSIAFHDNGFKIAISNQQNSDLVGASTEISPASVFNNFNFEDLKINNEKPSKPLSNNLLYQYGGLKLARPKEDEQGTLNISAVQVGEVLINKSGEEGSATSFTFTKEGKVLVGYNLGLVLYNSDGTQINKFIGHTGGIVALALSNDGKYAASLGTDKTIKIWDLNNGDRPLVSLFVSQKNDLICFTEDKYYASSKKGGRNIGFVIHYGKQFASSFVPFEQLDLIYNRPDKVLEALGNKNTNLINVYQKAHERRMKKSGYQETSDNSYIIAPFIDIFSYSGVTNNNLMTLKFNIHEMLYAVKKYEVFINGINVYKVEADKTKKYFSEWIEIKLNSGINNIKVVATDITGMSALKSIIMDYKQSYTVKPNLFIVTLGVSDYANTNYNLTYPQKDANDIVKNFESNKTAFKSVKTLALNNVNANKNNLSKIKEFLSQSYEDDQIIIFAAGHGLLSEDLEWYFALNNTDFNNPANGGITLEELESVFEGVRARKRLMLIDACHSGEVDTETTTLAPSASVNNGTVKSRGFKNIEKKTTTLANSFDIMQQFFNDLNKGTGAVIISAAGGAEFAYESAQWSNGVFTYAFLEGIRSGKADLDKNGEILVSEITQYVSSQVSTLTNGKQTPTSRKDNIEMDFRVW